MKRKADHVDGIPWRFPYHASNRIKPISLGMGTGGGEGCGEGCADLNN